MPPFAECAPGDPENHILLPSCVTTERSATGRPDAGTAPYGSVVVVE